MRSKLIRALSFFLVFSMLLISVAACAPRETPVPPTQAPAANTEAPKAEASQPAQAAAPTEAPKLDHEAAKFGGTATFVILSDPQNINYFASQGGNIDVQIRMATSDWLTIYNPNTGKYEPRILESWSQSEDGKVWTMKIRDGVKWHDGVQLTAEDLVFTKELMVNPDLDILDNEIPVVTKKYAVVDKLTYTVTSDEPNNSELSEWVGVLPKHIWEKVDPKNFSKAPEGRLMVGCGPFKMTEYKVGEYIRFDRFDDYWGGKPYLDTIYYRIIGDNAAANAALESGQVDMVTVDATNAEQMIKNPKVSIWQGPSGNVNRLYFNLKNELFLDHRVREAFAHLMQRETYVEQAMRGFADPAYSDFAPTDFYYLEGPYKQYEFSVEKANQLLQEAGFVKDKDGIYAKDGKRLEFEFYYTPGAPQAGVAILIMTPVFAEAGIKLIPKIPDEATLGSMWDTHNFVLLNSGTTMGPDPMRYNYIFGTNTAKDNIMQYQNEDVKALFKKAMASSDDKERKSIYEEIQAKIAADIPNLPLWYRHTIYAYNKNLVIDDAIPVGYVHFRLLHMDKLYLKK
ncbi:MAG: ABC transporter substrate-binding protein [Anaerolineaceae bacterium]|nr:ABC transporter substrate-binding protein [Anaerolineaceae bacterium]